MSEHSKILTDKKKHMTIRLRMFTGDTSNDIHSPGPVCDVSVIHGKLVPSSHQRDKPTVLSTSFRKSFFSWRFIQKK